MKTATRKANLKDLPSILDIENQSFTGDGFSKRQFQYLIQKAKAMVLVLCEKDLPVAYSVLLLPKKRTSARVYSIAVLPSSRGRGLGKELLICNINKAQSQGYQRLNLEVREDNTGAISLYEILGFRKTGIKENYYQDGTRAFSYSLALLPVEKEKTSRKESFG